MFHALMYEIKPIAPFPVWTEIVLSWFEKQPVLQTLLILIGLDIVTGILVSIGNKNLDSSISWRGMSRKALTIVLVGVAAAIEPFAHGVPLMNLTAMFYCVSEAISIVENAAAAGVPLPQALVDVLAKLREDKKSRRRPVGEVTQPVATPVNVNVNIPKE